MVDAAKNQAEPNYVENVTEEKASDKKVIDDDIGKDMDDLLEAVELVVTSQLARPRCCSASCASASPRRDD